LDKLQVTISFGKVLVMLGSSRRRIVTGRLASATPGSAAVIRSASVAESGSGDCRTASMEIGFIDLGRDLTDAQLSRDSIRLIGTRVSPQPVDPSRQLSFMRRSHPQNVRKP